MTPDHLPPGARRFTERLTDRAVARCDALGIPLAAFYAEMLRQQAALTGSGGALARR